MPDCKIPVFMSIKGLKNPILDLAMNYFRNDEPEKITL